jgi:hypothetical protein
MLPPRKQRSPIEDAGGANHRSLSRLSEEHMFVTIRRYSPKNGAINKASLELLRRQMHDEFLPVAKRIPGFRAYYIASVDDRELLTVSLCDTKEGAAETGRCAAEYTLRNPLVFELGRPDVVDGDVLTFAEGARKEPGPEVNGGGAAAKALALWFDESRGMLLTASER